MFSNRLDDGNSYIIARLVLHETMKIDNFRQLIYCAPNLLWRSGQLNLISVIDRINYRVTKLTVFFISGKCEANFEIPNAFFFFFGYYFIKIRPNPSDNNIIIKMPTVIIITSGNGQNERKLVLFNLKTICELKKKKTVLTIFSFRKLVLPSLKTSGRVKPYVLFYIILGLR